MRISDWSSDVCSSYLPKLLLLDEPTSALDPKISREVMGLIRSIARELGVPTLCNIHDVQLAKEFCNRIIGLQDGVKMFDGPTEKIADRALEAIYAMEILCAMAFADPAALVAQQQKSPQGRCLRSCAAWDGFPTSARSDERRRR